MTMLTRSTSIPRPKISVATKIRFSNALNAVYRLILWERNKPRSVKDRGQNQRKYANAPFLLLKARVDTNTREVVVSEQFIKLISTGDRLDEDDDLNDAKSEVRLPKGYSLDRAMYLVELKGIEEVIEFPVLPALLQLDVMLLQTVERKLGLVVDEDFERLRRNDC